MWVGHRRLGSMLQGEAGQGGQAGLPAICTVTPAVFLAEGHACVCAKSASKSYPKGLAVQLRIQKTELEGVGA